MAAVEKPQRAVEVGRSRAEAADAMADMEIDAPQPGADEGEDLYTRLKLGQRQLEFYEIQVSGHPYHLSSAE